MTITVRLFARLRELIAADSARVDLPDGSAVAALRKTVADRWPAAALLVVRSAVAVNGEYAADDRPLSPADEIALIPPVSGGAG